MVNYAQNQIATDILRMAPGQSIENANQRSMNASQILLTSSALRTEIELQ
jgi:hypothetical protein